MRPYSARREYQLSKVLQPSALSRDASRALIDFPAKLTGIRVLDIGAGESDCTAWLNKQGASAYAIDPRYRDVRLLRHDTDITLLPKFQKCASRYGTAVAENLRRSIERTRGIFMSDMNLHPNYYIAALAGSLPFSDESFDFIYSIDCITKGLDEDETIFRQAINEALRVLRRDGTLQLHPYLGYGNSPNAKNQKKVFMSIPHSVGRLNENGLDYSFRIRIRKS